MTTIEQIALEVARVKAENLKLRARIAELEKLVKLNIEDTGGGCAVCGMSPAIFHNGDNWLCWQCVQDAIEGQSASLQAVADAREAITAAAQFVGDPKTYDLLITWLARYPKDTP